MRAFLFLLSAGLCCAQNAAPLFVIERSLNANVVHYDARLTADGKLDLHQPVIAYWIMAAEDGRRQELSMLERLKAYGFTALADNPGQSCKLVLAAEKRRQIEIVKEANGVHAEMTIGGHLAYLHRVFVGTHKSFGLPMPSYVELFGSDVMTGGDCYEKVFPEK